MIIIEQSRRTKNIKKGAWSKKKIPEQDKKLKRRREHRKMKRGQGKG